MIKIYKFNNYYNRIIKKYDTVAEYDYDHSIYYTQNVINFDPGNGIQTEIVIGTSNYNGDGDYLLYIENNAIVSRWFIIDTFRIRKGQYRIILKRDLIADNYNNILNCPMLINKGMVNYDNPLVFNNEGMSFNEIKQQEIPLTDTKNNFPYIVLYCAKNAEVQSNIPVKADFTTKADIEINQPLANSIYNPGTYNAKSYKVNLELYFENLRGTLKEINYNANSDGNRSIRIVGTGRNYPYLSTALAEENISDVFNSLNEGLSMSELLTAVRATEFNTITTERETAFNNIISKGSVVLRDSEGAYYRISIDKTEKSGDSRWLKPEDGSVYNFLNTSMTNIYDTWRSNASESLPGLISYPFKLDNKYYEYQVIATPMENLDFTVTFDPTGKVTTEDSECNIMLFPYGDVVTWKNGILLRNIDKDTQLSIARAIAQKSSSFIYDMQLLPYAPSSISRAVTNDIIDASELSENQYTEFEYEDIVRGVCFWCDSANFTLDIEKPLTVNKNAIDYKIDSNCNKYRLCSPNYNGIFEFNTAKNGNVDFFNIDVTYRPYNPYIHINPNFKSLYGTDFNDARGLICGGDFSLPITGDKFAEYELNNKNYLNVFNREIQHMDFENNINNINAAASAIAGTFTGAAAGAATGGISTGNPYGAAIGAVVGGVASGIGGLVDYSLLQQQQKENKDLAIDMFNYRLGNIKALPYSLNKVTPLTYNNKIFPFVEYYTCTDEEKEILRNKIKYNGMTLNTINTISNIKTNYTEDTDIHFYQGTPIRLENTMLNADEVFEIFNELQKGVYL